MFSEHGDFVFRTLQYLGVPGPSLDDGLQDVFVTAHRRWDAFEGRSTPRTWLYGIARRVAFRYRRKHENHRRRFVLTERVMEGVDAPFEKANARRSVQALLEGLDEDKRAAFVLVEVEGFTAAEAAGLLGIPLGTVYSRVRAAWARLREAAKQDVHVASMKVEMKPERRGELQRAVMAACLPAASLGTATAATGLGVMTWALAAAGTGLLAVGISVAMRPDAPTPASPAPVAMVADASPPSESASPPALAPTQPIQHSAGAPPPAVIELPQDVAQSEPERPTPAQRRRGRAATSPDANEPPATLVEELALIRRAKELARDGKPKEAQAVLDEHARRFSDGQLVDERREIRAALASTKQAEASQTPRRPGR